MEYSDDYLREYLPREDPPAEYVPEDVADEIQSWIETSGLDDRGLIARSTRWTYAMFQELQQRQVQIRFRGSFGMFWGFHGGDWGFWRMAIGLYDPRNEEPGFGLVLSRLPSDAPGFDIIGTIEFPRLRAEFPLALRNAQSEQHAPPHPKGATSAAWARCNSTSLWGVLTAGHAVGGSRPGRSVPLASGGAGSLVRSFHPPIDAAFVHTAPPPSGTAPLAIRSFPAAGQPVTIEIQAGGVRRTVVEAMDALGVVNTRAFAVLMFTDQPCALGDSGALVRTHSGEAVGLYIGSLKNSRTPNGLAGMVQNFEQAALALDITTYA